MAAERPGVARADTVRAGAVRAIAVEVAGAAGLRWGMTTGAFLAVSALDFVTPDTAGQGAKDGNAAGNFTAVSATITGLNIAANTHFWIRWTDIDATGSDDGLAIDNFSLTARGVLGEAPVTVPEPGSLALASLALLGLLRTRRGNGA